MNALRTTLLGTALALLASAGTAAAQTPLLPLSVEARLDAGLPVGDAGDVLDTGFGWGVQGNLGLTPNVGLYVGYSRFEFDIDGPIGGDVTSDGWEVGGRFSLGSNFAFRPFAQVGAVFHEETGVEVGLGAIYPIAPTVSITPMVRYRSIDDLDYVTLGAGVRLAL